MDPKNLNAGPDLQLYERVPIQRRGTGFKKIQGTDIKIEVPIQREVPDSRKIKVPTEKTKVPIQYRTKKNAALLKTKLKGGNRHQNKKF